MVWRKYIEMLKTGFRIWEDFNIPRALHFFLKNYPKKQNPPLSSLRMGKKLL